MTTIQIRTDAKLKKSAQKLFAELGLNLSGAINVFLVQAVQRKGMPFTILTENGMTPQMEAKILKEEAWAIKHGKRYTSTKAMFKDILDK